MAADHSQFADRIEIHSSGDFPTGIRAELRMQAHLSVPRNPLIAAARAVTVTFKADVPCSLAELVAPSGRTDRTEFRAQVVAPLLEAGLLEMTIPDKPRSSKQQYRITDLGRLTKQAFENRKS